MIDTPGAEALLAVARALEARPLPDHLADDLAEIVEAEHLPDGARRAAAWLLRRDRRKDTP